MRKFSALMLLAAGCAAPAQPPADENTLLVRGLPATEAQLVERGEAAVPALLRELKAATAPAQISSIARALGEILRATRSSVALNGYLASLSAAQDAKAAALLEQAPYFRDPDGEVLSALIGALLKSTAITAPVVRHAAAMTEFEALEAMMIYVSRTVTRDTAAGRDVAFRYLGRAARRGRSEALDFLSRLVDIDTPECAKLARAELHVAAGNITPRTWRGWYLSHAKKSRNEWITEAVAYSIGGAFDPSQRADVERLIDWMHADAELEPEFVLLEPLLGRRFGYVSPRDVFTDSPELAAENAVALDRLKKWWHENRSYMWYDASVGRWELNGQARDEGKPVDPATGVPVKDPPK